MPLEHVHRIEIVVDLDVSEGEEAGYGIVHIWLGGTAMNGVLEWYLCDDRGNDEGDYEARRRRIGMA